MKSFYLILAALIISISHVQALSVRDVKVSVTADSAAAAREQAIEKAHILAFEKLVQENFPEKTGALPSPDTLMNMVTNFSIDKEKTTPKSYAASLSFQFDGSRVQAWLQKTQVSSAPPVPASPFQDEPADSSPSQRTHQQTHPWMPAASTMSRNNSSLHKVIATYGSLPEWQHIRKALEETQGMIKVDVTNVSAQRAAMDIQYGGDMGRLQQQLAGQGLVLSPQGNEWTIVSTGALR